jgi:hypothetical protein
VQHALLQAGERRQVQRAHQLAQLAPQGRARVAPEIDAEALEQRLEQQLDLQVFGGDARRKCRPGGQCSHTRISDSSWATSTGLVM